MQTTYVYKTAANRLYPVIAPYAEKISHSPYVNDAIEHLKPQVRLSQHLFYLLRLQFRWVISGSVDVMRKGLASDALRNG